MLATTNQHSGMCPPDCAVPAHVPAEGARSRGARLIQLVSRAKRLTLTALSALFRWWRASVDVHAARSLLRHFKSFLPLSVWSWD